MKKRSSGILCHITSLPSPFGIGDLGPDAYRFADFLVAAKQNFWQVLPLNPTNRKYLDSPFSSISSCAGNTVLISPQLLVEDGLVTPAEAEDHPGFPDRVDYQAVSRFKRQLFGRAHARFKEQRREDGAFAGFCRGNAGWLEDHALYTALVERLDARPLHEWPAPIRSRDNGELARQREQLHEEIEREKFLQFVFCRQWHRLKSYCNDRGIRIIGDFPMFMNYDAADIWVAPELFKVDHELKPLVLAGSPPDTFSEKGQLFNCAVYDWNRLRETGFQWWLRRFRRLFELFDHVRIDHFRGLTSCWEVPAGAENAQQGSWQPVPGSEFLDAMVRQYPTFPVIAEDLGVITAEVREQMCLYGIPGMKVLVVAFQDDAAIYLPHNHSVDSVAYTGTHDTNTVQGWFDAAAPEEKERLARYLGRAPEGDACWEVIRLALMSVARTAVIQMQDLLGGGAETRMNTPGRPEGNWQWRLPPSCDLPGIAGQLADLTVRYNRAR
ncbi:4-alpha-glucanotransferase [Geomonas oryzisoli]|uniref:4-alpha-glucanotransferase n=1 Tax=Geomonas oryzisoli TaxID=2847992 RepID=A0ABX8J349_9BACT|nr:4-alpha-glucanotransferase [Geomonas oryzisoli]QWV92705.1 4-alpha-glucanotransferase [Geomonas oryzisoli]